MTEKRDKVTVDDIIGLIQTDEPTNSVELKKEAYMNEKRFKVAVYDDKAINGFTVLDLQKPNSSKRLKYENVYIGSKVGCDIVCKFGNSLADENEQLKQSIKGQELEIVRLHHLADAMNGVLRELDIYDVYNQEQIMKVKEKLQ